VQTLEVSSWVTYDRHYLSYDRYVGDGVNQVVMATILFFAEAELGGTPSTSILDQMIDESG
jgi:hypothetical protein